METPLLQLRKAIVAENSIAIDKTSIIINDTIHLDRKALTNFSSLHGRGDLYSLEAVYFQYHFRDLVYNAYVQASQKEGAPHVILIDKRDILAYLTGRINTCPGIADDKAKAAPSTNPARQLSSSAIDSEGGSRPPIASTAEQDLKSSAAARLSPSAADGGGDSGSNDGTFASNRLRVRDQRSVDSVLMLRDWDFSSLRDKLGKHVTATKKGKPTGEAPSSQRKSSSGHNASAAFDPRGDRYTNNEGRFWRENMGSDFHELGIDMSGSFKAKPTSNGTAPPPSSQAPARSHDRSADMRRPPTKEVSSKRPKIDLRKAIPIIIVPSGMTSLVCSGNAIEMLQNSRFMSQDEMRKNKVPSTQPARLTMMRKPGGNCSLAQYHVITNPSRMETHEWDQVVAVVCSGTKWQFQNWPIFKNSTFDLFRKVQGFYFHYDDVAPVGDVEKWAIKKLTVSREKRHTDGQVHSLFWNNVDAFIARNRMPLRY